MRVNVTPSQNTLTSQTTLIERIEHYVKEQQDVGIDKAANDLNIPKTRLFKVAAASSNITVGPEQMTLRWKQFYP